ncbi:hypothetical protein BP6252_05834 [Coleophoma cylindrospora]|uniref:Uncharacterized protein n=1 Tax=Coleophoma cylindrospora TaxID=1849047 RepID=A0A3D8RVF0_9HELO|nr:hypothetical protein BP6252_05834 [Coleophoma cylindrospora]
MAPSLRHLAALALATLSRVSAFDDISIASHVVAGQDAHVFFQNDISLGSDSFDAQYTNYRVYLSISPPGWGSNPCCWLVNSSAIDVVDLKVQIPASVGPSASNYSIVAMEFITDSELYGSYTSGFEYSRDFTLTGGTGVWSAYETSPSGPFALGDADNIPCSAYECARNCNQQFYPANLGDDPNTYESAYESTYKCVAACPGVTYLSWDALMSGDDGSSTSSTSSSGATATSVASSGSTQSTASSTTKSEATATSATSITSTASSNATVTTTSNSSSASVASTTSARASASSQSSGAVAGSASAFGFLVAFLVSFLVFAHN